VEGSAVFAEWPLLTPSIESRFFRQPPNKDNKHAQTSLIALTALIAHIFRTTESPIAGPARFPDLVRLVRTFLHRTNTKTGPSLPGGAA
jgi:hypothetical protein